MLSASESVAIVPAVFKEEVGTSANTARIATIEPAALADSAEDIIDDIATESWPFTTGATDDATLSTTDELSTTVELSTDAETLAIGVTDAETLEEASTEAETLAGATELSTSDDELTASLATTEETTSDDALTSVTAGTSDAAEETDADADNVTVVADCDVAAVSSTLTTAGSVPDVVFATWSAEAVPSAIATAPKIDTAVIPATIHFLPALYIL